MSTHEPDPVHYEGAMAWLRESGELVSVQVVADVTSDSVVVHSVSGVDLRETSTDEFLRLAADIRKATKFPRGARRVELD